MILSIVFVMDILVLISASVKRDKRVLVFSGLILSFSIFNFFSQDFLALKPIAIMTQSEVFRRIIITLFVQFIVAFYSFIVSFTISNLIWIFANKESLKLKMLLQNNYKIAYMTFGIYILISLFFKDINIMWLSFWYFIYYVFIAFRKKVYVEDTINIKIIQNSILSITLLVVSTLFFYWFDKHYIHSFNL